MASLPKPESKLFLNDRFVPGVRSVDLRIAANESLEATIVVFCDDIQIDENGQIYLKTS